jgi:hypothetical protein
MSYSNDQIQIRSGLVNYIGALLKSSPFEGRAGKQNVSALLVEETLKLALDENNTIDLYTVKPLIRGMVLVCKQRIVELSKIQKNTTVDEQINKYKSIIILLEDIVSMV